MIPQSLRINGAAGRLLVVGTALACGIAIALASGALAGPSPTLGFKQSVAATHFKVSGLPQLAAGSGLRSICWHITPEHGAERSWCASRRSQSAPWQFQRGRPGARLRVTRSSALLALDTQRVGLTAGSHSWRFDTAPCPTDTDERRPATDCRTTQPPGGVQQVRLRSVVPTRCRVDGTTEVRRGARRGTRVALTFDDGPGPWTQPLRRELKKLRVRATFFVVGRRVKTRGAVLRGLLRDGHELANHSWDHSDLRKGGPAATRQIRETNRAVHRATGFTPCLMRPPYGATGPDLVRRIRAERMTSVLWDVDPLDWQMPGTGKISGIISANTRPGSIILEHDAGGRDRSQTVAAVARYVKRLKVRGFTFVTVSELLGNRTTRRLAD